ncbi:MAG: hypothetical protein V9E87_07145 [Gemmatimonadales bacterium]
MSTCFVIQPFDGGPFDKRYDDVIAPAIVAAGLEPYRVDRDPRASIPIDAIMEGIRGAVACVADISIDNPNVWFELGVAIATGLPLVLVCDEGSRTHFPFDVQHRHVVKYRRDSSSDFATFTEELTTRLAAAMQRESVISTLVESPLEETEGLDAIEMTALALIAEYELDRDSAPSAHAIKNDMAKAGFTHLAAVLGVKALGVKGLLESFENQGYNGEEYTAYALTAKGTDWLMRHRDLLALRKSPNKSRRSPLDADFE